MGVPQIMRVVTPKRTVGPCPLSLSLLLPGHERNGLAPFPAPSTMYCPTSGPKVIGPIDYRVTLPFLVFGFLPTELLPFQGIA